MTVPYFLASTVEGLELGWVAWDLQLGGNPVTVKVYMELWAWEYGCVGRRLWLPTWGGVSTIRSLQETNAGRRVQLLPWFQGVRPTEKPRLRR